MGYDSRVQLSVEGRVSETIFQDLRPSCVKLSDEALATPDNEGSTALLDALKSVDSNLKQSIEKNGSNCTISLKLADYIFFPLGQLLKRPSLTDSELEHILSILDQLCFHCWTISGHLPETLFKQLMAILPLLIGGPPNDIHVEKHSEETILNGVLCVKHLLEGAQRQRDGFMSDVLTDMKMVPVIGHTVSVLLSCALKFKELHIQVSSLQALNLLLECWSDGDSISMVLPGIVSSIARIRTLTPHYEVMVEAIKVLASALTLSFNDFELDAKLTKPLGIEELGNIKKEPYIVTIDPQQYQKGHKMHRNNEWLQSTMLQVDKGLKIILKPYSNWLERSAYRDSVFHLDISILRNCLVTCSTIIPTILSSMSLIYSYDPTYERLMIESLMYGGNMSILKSSLKSMLDDKLGALSFEFGSPDSDKAIGCLRSITFITRCLDSLDDLTSSILKQILVSIHSNLTIMVQRKDNEEVRSKNLMNDHPSVHEEYSTEVALATSGYSSGKFVTESEEHNVFSSVLDSHVEDAVTDLLISFSGNITAQDLISDTNLFDDHSTIATSVYLWILDSMTKHARKEFNKTQNTATDAFLDIPDDTVDKIDQLILYNVGNTLEVANGVLDNNSTSTLNTSGSVNSTVMSLKAVGDSCTIMGESFREELIDSLYPVIECLTSPHEDVRTEAQYVTMHIAKTLYAGSVPLMLKKNTDYLLDSLSMHLTGESLNPRLPILLIILIRIGGTDIIEQLGDVIRTIFTLLDLYYGYTSLCEGFMMVFQECVRMINLKYFKDFDFIEYANSMEEEDPCYPNPWGMNNIEDVINYIQKKPDSVMDTDTDSDDEDIDVTTNGAMALKSTSDSAEEEHPDVVDEPIKWTSPVNPKVYSLLIDMLEYAERLSKNRSVKLTILTLELIDSIIPIISTQKDKFLPVVAQLWDFVVSFVFSKDARIITRTLIILKDLVIYANSFLSSRLLDLFNQIESNKEYLDLLKKWSKYYQKLIDTQKVINRTSTSVNWDRTIFESVCDLFQTALLKFGRLVPMATATKIASITVHYDSDEAHYGYFDDLILYLKSL